MSILNYYTEKELKDAYNMLHDIELVEKAIKENNKITNFLTDITLQEKLYEYFNNNENHIELYNSEKELIKVKFSTFPAGEEYVKIIDIDKIKKDKEFEVILTSAESKWIMRSILLADAVKQINKKASLILNVDYLPYGRQDRVCNPGESFSLKVFNDIISKYYSKIISYDVHSQVSQAIISNKNEIFKENIFFSLVSDVAIPFPMLESLIENIDIVISPDKGAVKRSELICKKYNKPIIKINKQRENGKVVYYMDKETNFNKYESGLIFDDICDGGATFIELAKKIKERNPNISLYLIISHGIFSKGIKELVKYYDDIIIPLDNYNKKVIKRLRRNNYGN